MSRRVTLAQAPFDDVRADLILQSSEKELVHFRVSKFILSIASPIFADMLSIPSPVSQSSRDEVQVVTLSEDSETLDLSLRHIYPLRSPEVAELPQMRMVAEFAHKYQVDALEQDVSRHLMDAVDRDPIGVYVIAITYGYKSVREKAFRLSLKYAFGPRICNTHPRNRTGNSSCIMLHVGRQRVQSQQNGVGFRPSAAPEKSCTHTPGL